MYVPKRESKYWNTADSFSKLAGVNPQDEYGGGFLEDYWGNKDDDEKKLSPYMIAAGGLAGGLAGHGISTLSKQFLGEDLGYAPEVIGALGGAYLGHSFQKKKADEDE